MPAALLALLLAAVLFVVLYLLVDFYLTLIGIYVHIGIAFFAAWVFLNIMGILHLKDHENAGLALLGNAWGKVMEYTGPYQALLWTVLLFWLYAVGFEQADTFPETKVAFVRDFIIGTAWLAYIVYVLAFGGFCLFIVPDVSVKLYSVAYIVGMGSVLAIPCFFGGRVETWLAAYGADRVLLAAHTVFLLGSAGGWMLFQAALNAPVPQATSRLS